ncbi:hypothetical protein PI95_027975 [Hassallia byssoidea VB512170]|uniref:Uncharacterized protein n=1 Tax=Hassallia byssoidea VB512170 TaxID=1304833 RepID=A0A846HFY1_9CYAN|nr:hypothetical protein [Hassalia byssoidea]NEU76262.1 hypothetical protein [Hassalia byssoidea VB512170]
MSYLLFLLASIGNKPASKVKFILVSPHSPLPTPHSPLPTPKSIVNFF